jgi:hypothetical protein
VSAVEAVPAAELVPAEVRAEADRMLAGMRESLAPSAAVSTRAGLDLLEALELEAFYELAGHAQYATSRCSLPDRAVLVQRAVAVCLPEVTLLVREVAAQVRPDDECVARSLEFWAGRAAGVTS